MVFIEIVKTALKRKCDWDIIGVTWSRSSGLSFRLCVIDQLWWWRHLLWLFFIHCWFEILNICALFDPHRGAHVIIVINSITRSCIQSALVDTWTKDDRIQESWSHIIIFLKDFYFFRQNTNKETVWSGSALPSGSWEIRSSLAGRGFLSWLL